LGEKVELKHILMKEKHKYKGTCLLSLKMSNITTIYTLYKNYLFSDCLIFTCMKNVCQLGFVCLISFGYIDKHMLNK